MQFSRSDETWDDALVRIDAEHDALLLDNQINHQHEQADAACRVRPSSLAYDAETGDWA